MTRPAAASKTPVDPLVAAVATLKRLGKQDEADRVVAVSRRIPPSRSVVVVGEVKRGKSSLVNGLLGVPGLARVDTEIATSAAVSYLPPTADRPGGTAALVLPDGRRRPIAIDEVSSWVTIDGTEAETEIDGMLPIGAEVVVESRHLPSTTVIDTPGVNGFDPRHLEATVAATAGACVIVMVCDALAPMSAAERDFLTSVSAEIGTVIVAVTKTDKALSSWRSIVEDNRRLLATYVPQFAGSPVVGVSNLFALKAMRTEDEKRAATLWKSSGVPELVQVIDRSLGSPRVIVRRNAVQCAVVALSGLQAELSVRRQAIVDAPRINREMAAEKVRLEELQSTQKEWSTRLGQRLNRLQLAADTATKQRVADFRQRWEEKFDALGVVGLSRHSQRLVVEMSAEIDAMCNGIVSELRDEMSAMVVDMMGDAFLRTGPMTEALENLASMDLRPPRDYERWKGFFDPQMISMAMAGGGFSALASGSGISLLAGPFALALIPVWGAVIVGFRAKRFGKQNLTKWLNETLRQAQEDTSGAVRVALNEFGPELRLVYADTIARSLVETQRLLKESGEQARVDDAERKKSLNVLDTDLVRIANVMKALHADRAVSGAAPSEPGVAPSD